MSVINALQLTASLVTTGGSNSSTQTIAANTAATPPVKRLRKVTVLNSGTNTASGRFYLGTASSGQPFASFRMTGGQYTVVTVWEDGAAKSRGLVATAGLLTRGALGTFVAQAWYTEGDQ